MCVFSANSLAPVSVVEKLEFRHMKAVSDAVGRDWKMLSRYLGLDEATIESIQQAYQSDLKEASYQALLRWVWSHMVVLVTGMVCMQMEHQ